MTDLTARTSQDIVHQCFLFPPKQLFYQKKQLSECKMAVVRLSKYIATKLINIPTSFTPCSFARIVQLIAVRDSRREYYFSAFVHPPNKTSSAHSLFRTTDHGLASIDIKDSIGFASVIIQLISCLLRSFYGTTKRVLIMK